MIGVLSFVNPLVWPGGGELYTRALLTAAREARLPFALGAVWPEPVWESGLEDADAFLIVDAGNLPKLQRRLALGARTRLLRPGNPYRRFVDLVTRVIDRCAYAHLDNAYVDICHQAYLPCGAEHPFDRCPIDPTRSCRRLATSGLYRNAQLCTFLSPLHEEVIRSMVGDIPRTNLLRPTIDTAPYLSVSRSSRRPNAEAFVGVPTAAKGFSRIADRYPDLLVVAPRPFEGQDAYRTVIGARPEEMPSVYATIGRVHLWPTWPEPFGRVVAEAALAGCRIDGNEQVGALSWQRDLGDPDFYAGAGAEFWSTFVAVVGS